MVFNPNDWPDGAMHRQGTTWVEIRIGRDVYRVDEAEVDADTKENMAEAMSAALQAKIDTPNTWSVRDVEDEDNAKEEADSDGRAIIKGRGSNKTITHRTWVVSLVWDKARGKYTLASRRTRR
jgi:hypothetical protein